MDDLLSMTDTAPLRTAEAQKIQRQLDMKKAELERTNKLLMSLYENLTDNIITRDEYARMKKSYAARAEEIEKQMNFLQDNIAGIRDRRNNDRSWIEQFRKHANITTLDRSVIVSLIDKIVVSADRCVTIVYRWQDEYEWQLDILARAGVKEAV